MSTLATAQQKASKVKDVFWILAISCLLYLPFLGGLHLFDWDEINFAEMAREMILLKDYWHLYINFEPFYEKPPLFIWLQVVSMKLWGINEYAARFPNAICGIITHLTIYYIGNQLYNRRMALLWTAIYAGSILPHWYFKSGIIDPWFNLFIFLGIYQIVIYTQQRSEYNKPILEPILLKHLFLAGLFTGLAILTKGPAALIISFITLGVFWILSRFKLYIHPLHFALYIVALVFTVSLWLGIEILNNGTAFVKEFLIRNYELFSTPDAGHKGFFGYHFVVLLFGAFPASLFAIRAMYNFPDEYNQSHNMRKWMIVLFWVVLILFSIVKTKIIHYSSLCYLPITFLASLSIDAMCSRQLPLSSWLKNTMLGIGIVLSLTVAILPWLGQNIHQFIPYIHDVFTQENLKAHVNWTGWESLVGLILLVAVAWSYYSFSTNKILLATIQLLVGVALTVQLIMYVFLNNIEAYTQLSAIAFFKKLQGKNCYVLNLGYKSYAQLFYFQKNPPSSTDELNEDWLLHGKIDRPLYIITKINRVEEIKQRVSDAKELYRENGFVFLIRRI